VVAHLLIIHNQAAMWKPVGFTHILVGLVLGVSLSIPQIGMLNGTSQGVVVLVVETTVGLLWPVAVVAQGNG
jgi:hypothetical protein